ncbi:cystatin-F [Genypterus blacodes]|uniref:cystatin-F n=1 Tax=Genypterus blacodes TaxID=154954 RepID=UPI003F7633FC
MRPTLLLVFLLPFLGQLVESRHLIGSPSSISTHDPRLLQAALTFTNSFNNQSNDAFLFKVSTIIKANKQLVAGMLYLMDLEISRTVCHKRDKNNDLSRCDFQPVGPLHQTFLCSSRVWVIVWLHEEKVSFYCTGS